MTCFPLRSAWKTTSLAWVTPPINSITQLMLSSSSISAVCAYVNANAWTKAGDIQAAQNYRPAEKKGGFTYPGLRWNTDPSKHEDSSARVISIGIGGMLSNHRALLRRVSLDTRHTKRPIRVLRGPARTCGRGDHRCSLDVTSFLRGCCTARLSSLQVSSFSTTCIPHFERPLFTERSITALGVTYLYSCRQVKAPG